MLRSYHRRKTKEGSGAQPLKFNQETGKDLRVFAQVPECTSCFLGPKSAAKQKKATRGHVSADEKRVPGRGQTGRRFFSSGLPSYLGSRQKKSQGPLNARVRCQPPSGTKFVECKAVLAPLTAQSRRKPEESPSRTKKRAKTRRGCVSW